MRSTKSTGFRWGTALVLLAFCFVQVYGSGIAPSAYQLIMQGGVALARRTTVNFSGAGINCVDNAGLLRTDCISTGGTAVAPGSGAGAFLYSATASATNAAAAEATVIGAGTGSLTLAADFFDPAGVTIKVQASGYYSTQIAPGTLRIRLKVGAATVLDTGAIAPVPSLVDQVWTYDAFVTSRSLGAKGSVMAQSEFRPNAGVPVGQDWPMINTAAVGLDTTVANTVDLTAEWSVGGGNTITGTNFLLYALTTTPGYATIQDAGTAITRRGIVNMGSGVYCVDNAGSTRSDCYAGLAVANEGGTGTTVNKLAKLTGAPSTAIISTAGDTGGAVGIVVAGAGVAGSAVIATSGTVSCVFDGATTAGHYVGISAGTAGDCTDAGAGYPAANQVIGRVLSTNGGAGTYAVVLFSPEIKASAGGGGGATIGTGTYAAIPAAGTAGNVYLATDTPWVLRDTGAAWVPFGPVWPLGLPPTAGWTAENMTGTSSFDSATGALLLTADTANQYNHQHRAAPGTPYTVTVLMDVTWTGSGDERAGVAFRQSGTGKYIKFIIGRKGGNDGGFAAISKFSDFNTFSADYVVDSASNQFIGPLWMVNQSTRYWLQISDTGANLVFRWSTDGFRFVDYTTQVRTDYLLVTGPDQVSVFTANVAAQNPAPSARYVSWVEN